jgi:hypothetical protein
LRSLGRGRRAPSRPLSPECIGGRRPAPSIHFPWRDTLGHSQDTSLLAFQSGLLWTVIYLKPPSLQTIHNVLTGRAESSIFPVIAQVASCSFPPKGSYTEPGRKVRQARGSISGRVIRRRYEGRECCQVTSGYWGILCRRYEGRDWCQQTDGAGALGDAPSGYIPALQQAGISTGLH